MPTDDRFPEHENAPPLDYSPSSGPVGSHEHNYDDAPQSHDGRAETHTTFYPEEATDDSRNWKRLAAINDGQYADDGGAHSTAGRTAARMRDYATFASAVELSDRQRAVGRHILGQITDVRPFESTENLLLATLTLAANRGDRRIRREDAFVELQHSCDVTSQELRRARNKLRERL